MITNLNVNEALAVTLTRLANPSLPLLAKGDYGRGYAQALADVATAHGLTTETTYVT